MAFTLTISADDLTALGAKGASGVADLRMHKPVLDVTSGRLVTSKPWRIASDTDGNSSSLVEDVPVGNALRVDAYYPGWSGRFFFSQPDKGTISIVEMLTRFLLDPSTLLPDASGQAAWDATLAQIQALADQVTEQTGSASDAAASAAAAEAAAASIKPGVAGGVATLDGDGLLPEGQVPERLSEESLSDTIVAEVSEQVPVVGAESFAARGRWPVLSVATVDPAATIGDDYSPASYTITETGKGVTYSGTCGIELHGNSTVTYPKKPYKLKLDTKTNILGMTHKAKKWVLLANWLDPAGINNSFAFDFGAQMSDWFVPQVKPVEMILNGRFIGFYLVVDDKKDIGSGRIPGDDPTDSPDDDTITGTYLLEADNKEASDPTVPGFTTTRGQFFGYDDEITNTAQIAYITGWMQSLEDALFGSDFLDPDTGWAQYVDMQSIADAYLINELTYNQDSASTTALFSSYFFYKTADAPVSDGKLYGGPLWDFDRSLGVWTLTTYNPPIGWKTRNAGWITQMFKDPTFWELVTERWGVLKTKLGGWQSWVDSTVDAREGALGRNYNVWVASLPAQPFAPQLADTRKQWLAARIAWLDPRLSAPANPVPATVTATV